MGDGEVDSVTVPLNPPRLLIAIVDVLVVPAGILRLLGFAVMAKSGFDEGPGTVKVTVTLCDKVPLDPVTVSA